MSLFQGFKKTLFLAVEIYACGIKYACKSGVCMVFMRTCLETCDCVKAFFSCL